MKRAVAVTWFALQKTSENLLPLTGIGLLWFAVAGLLPLTVFWLADTFLPVPPIVAILVLVALVPAPPATVAVYWVTYHVTRGSHVEFRYLWEGFKRYAWSSYKIAGLLFLSGVMQPTVIVLLTGETSPPAPTPPARITATTQTATNSLFTVYLPRTHFVK